MERAEVNGVELDYEVIGSGEPVLLISPVVADGFLPLVSALESRGRYRFVRYHRRGWCGSTHTAPPVTIRDHAADAIGLLEYLQLSRAHVIGHSHGGAIALQLAFERPDLVHTLALLEPALYSLPSAALLFERAAPSVEAYCAGDMEGAVAGFLRVASGLELERCLAVLDEHVPGGFARAVEDADTLFGVELPAVVAWTFGPEQAATISQPVLSVLGAETDQLWVDAAATLRCWFPKLDERRVDGVGHLLHMQNPAPVARGLGAFLSHHPIGVGVKFHRSVASAAER